jgi:arylsulfatase A-like enzyme
MRKFSNDLDDPACIPESLTTMAESLHASGYHTIGVINNALLFRPLGFDQGFDQWIEIGKRTPAQTKRNPDEFGILGASRREFRNTLRILDASLDSRVSDRFFLYVHFMDVHDYALMKGQRYDAAVSRADEGVGGVIRALKDRGLLEDSVVILTSDHGERLDEEHFTEGLPYHFGDPSFEEHIRVPLIVAPAMVENPDQPLRSDDVYRLILEIAGVANSNPPNLEQGELYVGEREYQIYRQGQWKSFVERETGQHTLIDLAADPMERSDVSAERPELVEKHRRRIQKLGALLKAENRDPGELSDEDERRLRALGYLD